MSIMLRLSAFALFIIAAVLFASALRIGSTAAQNANSSTTQNANSSTTTNRNQNDSRSIGPAQQDFSKNTWELPEDADKTPNPVEATAESVAKGKELYLERTKGNCIFCHGETGAGNEANLPRLRRKPADLSNKERMSTRTDGELFWKISKGITGIMPAGEKRMTEQERWNVVNYVKTLSKKQ